MVVLKNRIKHAAMLFSSFAICAIIAANIEDKGNGERKHICREFDANSLATSDFHNNRYSEVFQIQTYVSQVLSGCLLTSALLLNGEGLPLSVLQGLRQNKVILSGAKVHDGEAASRLAIEAYASKSSGVSAYESSSLPVLVELGFPIRGYARQGDKIWEVRITSLTQNGTRSLRAILWIHSQTAQVYFLCSPEAHANTSKTSVETATLRPSTPKGLPK